MWNNDSCSGIHSDNIVSKYLACENIILSSELKTISSTKFLPLTNLHDTFLKILTVHEILFNKLSKWVKPETHLYLQRHVRETIPDKYECEIVSDNKS